MAVQAAAAEPVVTTLTAEPVRVELEIQEHILQSKVMQAEPLIEAHSMLAAAEAAEQAQLVLMVATIPAVTVEQVQQFLAQFMDQAAAVAE
jgi:CTP:molybdopterin cytidylyltransferase MocA